ncbi:MAG TPA: hypothetical protein VGF99_04040 [Myxococcota bacterium]
MRVPVVVIGPDALQRLVDDAIAGTSARRVALDVDAALVAPIFSTTSSPAAVVVESTVGDEVVAAIVKRVPDDERHRFLVVRDAKNVDIARDWTVVRTSEVARGVQMLVADAEAVVVELLARVRDVGVDVAPRFGCVVSVASSFVLVAIDEHIADAAVHFVLPGEGKVIVEGKAIPVPWQAGLFRISPVDETVRAALLRFTIRRAETAT